ncbi:MAG TPA: hypothetical protein VF753_05485 [Terriglobales bacterium]
MKAVTGLFNSQAAAEHAVKALRVSGIPADKITVLAPGDVRTEKKELQSVPIESTEESGMGPALGTVVGAAGGLWTGAVIAAFIPGVGVVSALGLLGAALMTAAGAGVGAAAGEALENSTTDGLPEDEIFLYEDALRKGSTVVLVMASNDEAADSVRDILKAEGSTAIDAARHHWWSGLRHAEQSHYATSGGSFEKGDDEKFYRMGFEAALHARTRCMEFDQVSAAMDAKLEEVQKQFPGVNVEPAFTRGYERGREHYQQLCDENKAA